MTLLRFGDAEDRRSQRSRDRFYRVGDDWFFAIRRGVDQGPYQTREDAQRALRLFIEEELRFESRLLGDKVSLSV